MNSTLNRKQLADLASGQLSAVPLRDALAAGSSLHDALAAGYSLRSALAAGYSLPDALDAGCSLRDALAAGYSLHDALAATPKIEAPYTRMLADIREHRRIHNQGTFGPDADPANNLCKTQMCTAGHLVNMAGAEGYALKHKFGWHIAAALIHEKAHPGWPCQNFNSIPQAWAIAYIEEMAKREAAELARGGSGGREGS